MELDRDQLIDCVRRCNLNNIEESCKYCTNCYLSDWDLGGFNCHDDLANEVISRLEADEQKIKELTEENEYLKQQNEIQEVLNKKLEDACDSYAWTYGTAVSKELFLKKERENTVREMQKRLTDRDEFSLRADYDGIYYIDHACWVNQVAAEILGEE